ncbi:hypothetical protein PG985_008917 [Apiospora marii]|uniref:uncharacterized protein n=1 Tax=Apiospora marii TaxID=335849 RepID=UPI003130D61A
MAPPIGFLDIPREIRDEIYSLLLRSGRLPNPASTSCGAVVESGGLNDVHLAILRTNRQIGNEAREVFYKINRLVRVSVLLETADISDLLATFTSKYLPPPMIRQLEPAIDPFKGFVMDYTITRIKSLANHTGHITFVMLHSDLHLLSLCLEHANIRSDTFGAVTKHSITLNNPFESTDKSYPTIDQQKMLLSPFAKLHGFRNVSVQGAVNPSLASQIVTQAQVKPHTDAEAILEDLRRQEQLGHEYLRQNQLDKSCEAWAGACKKIESITMPSGALYASLTLPGSPWMDQLQELFFELNQKLWATVIRIMEANLNDHDLVNDLADLAIRGLSHTLWKGAFRRTNWKPGSEQKAALLLQKSSIYRLRQNFRKALREVKRAEALCPDDPDVLGERLTVECHL